MQIIGLNSVTGEQLKFELQTGGRFVVLECCISILIMTFKRFLECVLSPLGREWLQPEHSLVAMLAPFWLVGYTLGTDLDRILCRAQLPGRT
jgi:hypothetical protein